MNEMQAWITGTLSGLLAREFADQDLPYEVELLFDGEGNHEPRFEVKDPKTGERVRVYVQALVPKRSPAKAEQRLQDEFQSELADMHDDQ